MDDGPGIPLKYNHNAVIIGKLIFCLKVKKEHVMFTGKQTLTLRFLSSFQITLKVLNCPSTSATCSLWELTAVFRMTATFLMSLCSTTL